MAEQRLVHFVLCSLGVFFCSFAFSFNAFGESVKEVFGLAQTEVELISSMYFLGTGLNLIPGYLYDKKGASWTVKCGLLLNVPAWLLVSGICRIAEFFRERYLILAALFFVAGHGKSLILMPTMVSGLNTFNLRHRGKAFAFLATLYTIGPLMSVVAFANFFTGINEGNSKKENLSNFLFGLGTLLSLAGVLFICSPIHKTPRNKEVDHQKDKNYANVEQLSYLGLLREKSAILFISSFALILGIAITLETNIPFVAESLGFQSYVTTLFIVHRFCQGSSRLAMGVLHDSVKSQFCRTIVYSIFGFFSMLGFFMWLPNFNNISYFVAANIGSGLARGVYPLILVMVCEQFDKSNHGKVYGLADTLLSFAILVFQETFGILYTSAIGEQGQGAKTCHGSVCVYKTTVLFGFVCLIGTAATLMAAFGHIRRQVQISDLGR